MVGFGSPSSFSLIVYLREGASRSSNQAESFHTEVKIRQNGSLNGDFLTLAPPAAAAPNLSSQCRDFLANSSFPQSSSEFGSQPTQCSSEDSIQGQEFSKPMRPPFFSFFPAAKNQVGQEPTPANSCNGELGENVDLSLKL